MEPESRQFRRFSLAFPEQKLPSPVDIRGFVC
jgi:hypothetical protein